MILTKTRCYWPDLFHNILLLIILSNLQNQSWRLAMQHVSMSVQYNSFLSQTKSENTPKAILARKKRVLNYILCAAPNMLYNCPYRVDKSTSSQEGDRIDLFRYLYDWVAAWGHIQCTRPHWTCHLWKLALGLCDVQLSSDFNLSETLTHTVKWPQELAIYGPRPDLWPLRFGKNFEPLSRLNLESYLSSYLWRTIFQLVCGISPYSALLGITGSFIAFAD